jgi:heptaprenyl diphosphate synthase
MQLQDKYRIAILSAYALALHGFEALIPSPIPWLRLGLANIIALTALVLFGFRTAMMITLIRVMLGSIFAGTFLGPSFILSLGGGIAGMCAMGTMRGISRKIFGPVGLSLIGALFHNAAQLFLAYLFFIQKFEAVLIISPIILLIGTVTGFVNGIVADILIKNLLKKEQDSIHNVVGA